MGDRDSGSVNRVGSQPAGQQPAAPAAVRTPVNILLVDDNPNKLLALETALAPLEENLVKVRSGPEALRALLVQEFAVIILDVSMPLMDGFEAARTIRGRPRSASTPIIFVSAINLGETDALRGYSLGAVDYIMAPIIPEVLRAKVSVFVQLYRMNEEARQHARELQERTRQLEESQTQLRLAERMASLGTLAAGLGHDMGNLLLPIQARLEEVNREPLPRNVEDCLSAVGTSINYLSRLASGLRLLALGPGDDSEVQPGRQTTDPISWWPEVEPLFRNAVPRPVELLWKPESDAPPIAIAKHLLTQLVFNLVQNAGEILRTRGSGTVVVSAEAADDGESVLVRVSDDGPGMSAEVRKRCLEPFFTTKSRTLSTGLGLAMVNGIIRRAGGKLEIDSVVDVGTTFTCRLPAASSTKERPPSAAVSVASHRLRAVVTSLLRVHGFEVESGDNGLGNIDLWVTDGGEESRHRVRSFLDEREGRRVLLLNGPDIEAKSEDNRILQLRSAVTASELRHTVAQLARDQRVREATPVPTASAG